MRPVSAASHGSQPSPAPSPCRRNRRKSAGLALRPWPRVGRDSKLASEDAAVLDPRRDAQRPLQLVRLRLHGVDRGPLRHPLAFRPFPRCSGDEAYLAPPLSQRDEEGFSSCSTCPGHRAVANHPARVARRVRQSAARHAAFAFRLRARPLGLVTFGATLRSLPLRPDDSLPIPRMGLSTGFRGSVSLHPAVQLRGS